MQYDPRSDTKPHYSLMKSKPTICVSICEQSASDMEAALFAAGPLADVIELRLDCLDQSYSHETFRFLDDLLTKSPKPIILTYRPAKQGGVQDLSVESRLNFWSSIKPTAETLFDIELDLARNASFEAPEWDRVICSHHDFSGLPADLNGLYEQLASTRARILKIAIQAHDATDCLDIFRLVDRARKDGRELIAIAMGEAGLMTRILGPSRGSFLTYAARDNQTTTAPGQISANTLREVYRIDKINSQTEIFGIVGSPVSHSLGPWIHNAAFEFSGKNAVYIPVEVRDISAFMQRMVHPRTREIEWNIRGLSVTAPHKLNVMKHLDLIDPAAGEIGAVNTIVITDEGLTGYNTDVVGFIQPLLQMQLNFEGLRCAVIGNGGVANVAVWALKSRGAQVSLFGRNAEKVTVLARKFDVEARELGGAKFQDFDLVVNATPLGTSGSLQSETPVSGDQLRGARLAYDLVYNPSETEFLRQAKAAGCETLGGTEMFLAQAREQFRIWTGSDAPATVMREAFKKKLAEK